MKANIAMNISLFKLLIQQAVHYRRSQGAMWLNYFIWVAVPIVVLLVFFLTRTVENPGSLQIMWVVGLGLLVLTMWPPLIKVIPLLLTPANARLVPGLRGHVPAQFNPGIMSDLRAAMCLVGVAFVAVVVLAAVLIGMPNGTIAKCACLIAMGLAGLTLITVGRLEGLVPYFGVIFMARRDAGEGMPLLILSGVAVLTSIYAFAWLFPRGERHWRSMGRIEKLHRVTSGQLPSASTGPSGLRRIVYGRVLARNCGQADAKGAMLWHVLGPNAHWTSPALALMLVLLICVLALALVSMMGWSSDFVQGCVVGILMALTVFGQLLYVQEIAMRMHATRTEQQLLRMTARMPQNEALNRLFVRQVLVQSAAMFAIALLLSIFASLMLEVSVNSVVRGLSLASLTVLLSTGSLRWITKKGNPTNIWPAAVMLLQMVAVGLVFAWCNAAQLLPWPALALPSLLMAGALLVRDVRKLMRGPVVLPLASA